MPAPRLKAATPDLNASIKPARRPIIRDLCRRSSASGGAYFRRRLLHCAGAAAYFREMLQSTIEARAAAQSGDFRPGNSRPGDDSENPMTKQDRTPVERVADSLTTRCRARGWNVDVTHNGTSVFVDIYGAFDASTAELQSMANEYLPVLVTVNVKSHRPPPKPKKQPPVPKPPKYLLYLSQRGGGCDYTIGCGETLKELDADTLEEAIKETTVVLGEYSEEREIDEAMIIRADACTDFDVAGFYAEAAEEAAAEEEKEARRKEEAEFERLAKKLGKK